MIYDGHYTIRDVAKERFTKGRAHFHCAAGYAALEKEHAKPDCFGGKPFLPQKIGHVAGCSRLIALSA